MDLNSTTKHLLHCTLFLLIMCVMEYFAVLNKKGGIVVTSLNPWLEYGVTATCVLYILRLLTFLALPQAAFNMIGLIIYNAFPDKVILKSSPLLAPLICIRVVTRGDYPELVKKNVERNMKTCTNAGLENFFIEVVSDKPVQLKQDSRIRELVIPPEYVTRTGARYKARALQYCLEDSINALNDKDWIVHLDEETLLTENCIKGILNFIIDGKYHIGQGLITYANEEVVNWITTLADTFRVTDDMGKLRLQFKMFHKPLFSFKGSYVVTQAETEKRVTFDNGLEGSIAEDCFFAIKASSMGYTFNFIEGEMWEKSPFTFKDFIQQRKRWLQGILLVVHSKQLPVKHKFLLAISCYAWVTLPLSVSNLFIAPHFPVPCPLIVDFLMTLVGCINIYMFIFGVLKSFSLKRLGVFKFLLSMMAAVAIMPFNIVLETLSALLGYFGKKNKFYVVQKI